MLDVFLERHVNIGIGPKACETKRTGVLWINVLKDGQKLPARVSIMIDRPERIKNGLNVYTWKRLKDQVEKLEIDATHLELTFENGNKFCYCMDEFKLLYSSNVLH